MGNREMEVKRIPYESTWNIRHEVMWPGQVIDYVKLPNDKNGSHFGLFVNDKLVSIVSAFISGEEAQFRKFATVKEEQGKGYGSKLLTYLMKELTTDRIERIWCNARVDKTGFYERFGMKKTDRSFSKGGIDYIIMERIA